jgi:serine phosphatase RsbU (regulator of sigma subunit)
LKFSVYILLFLLSVSTFAQKFADKDYFLVDSLDFKKLSYSDKFLIDSCLTVFYKASSDTSKIAAITIIVEESWDDNVWPKYNEWTHQFIKRALAKKNTPKIQKYLLNSYAGTINNIGFNFKNRGEIEKALEYYHKSLKIKEKIGDKKGIAVGLNNIAIILENQGDIEKALGYYRTCLKLQKEIKDDKGVARSYSNIGLAYFNQKNIIKAIEYCRKSTVLQEKIGDKKGLATSLNNLAAIYSEQGNLARSLEYHKKSLALEIEIGNKQGIAWGLNNVGSAHMKLGNYSEAIISIEKSMKMGREIGVPLLIKNAAKTFVQVYEKQNEGMKALKMHKLYISMRDSINNVKTQKASAKQQMKYEYEKQKAIDDAKHDKLIALKQEEKKKQQIISYAIAFGLALVIVFLLFVFNRLKITRKQKMVIEEQTKDIVDSITYAKRIQKAILPTDLFVKECLPDSFVYYKPKDIVAGDFYWVEKIENNILFAAADCTGHGVPGAMVSVVCHNAMDRALRESNLSNPGEILDKTREIVVEQLNKSKSFGTDSIDNIRDGMDIALCFLNTKTNQLKYAGAYNPLWIIRNESNEIEEIKANRQSIGKVKNPKPFKTHQVELEKGDRIYTFSDGYADQFGGVKGKKMMNKSFKEFLVSIKDEPMEEQLKSINNHFEVWKGNQKQIDDVCVIGVKI